MALGPKALALDLGEGLGLGYGRAQAGVMGPVAPGHNSGTLRWRPCPLLTQFPLVHPVVVHWTFWTLCPWELVGGMVMVLYSAVAGDLRAG